MSELSMKALAILQDLSSNGKKRFSSIDLERKGFSPATAKYAIDELEECGYIEVNHRFINRSFELI